MCITLCILLSPRDGLSYLNEPQWLQTFRPEAKRAWPTQADTLPMLNSWLWGDVLETTGQFDHQARRNHWETFCSVHQAGSCASGWQWYWWCMNNESSWDLIAVKSPVVCK